MKSHTPVHQALTNALFGRDSIDELLEALGYVIGKLRFTLMPQWLGKSPSVRQLDKLTNHTYDLVQLLKEEGDKNPVWRKSALSRAPAWPENFSAWSKPQKEAIARRRQFSPLPPGKQLDPSTPANALFISYLKKSAKLRGMPRSALQTKAELSIAKLPSFTKATCRMWAEALWALILQEHCGHPEEDPELRKIGESAAQKRASVKSRNASIRAKIKERFVRAAISVANTVKDAASN